MNPCFAENFYIKNYDIDIIVNSDKSIQLKLYTYILQTHGIYRDIPFKNASVTDIRVYEINPANSTFLVYR